MRSITASPVAKDISDCWSDMELIQCLDKMQKRTPGSPLPSNIILGVNPCQFEPANLPEDIWYYVPLEGPKQTKRGFWKEKGEPCQIYSDSSVTGWRGTLEFFEGHTSNGHRTGWMMQEYWIAQKDPIKPKGSSSLCRVFLCNGEGGTNALPGKDNRSDLASMSTFRVKRATGDFLELDDLVTPLSSSPSSGNSSCVSEASDGFFDPAEMLQELEHGDDVFLQTKPTGHKFSVSKPNEMVVTLSTGGSPEKKRKSPTEHIKEEQHFLPTASTPNRRLPDKGLGQENAKARPLSASSGDVGGAAASSSAQKSDTDKGKKVALGKTLKKFCCFIAF